MKKIVTSLVILSLTPLSAFATDANDASSMITQMRAILDQYALRIQSLENENKILKEEIAKAGIKIPLSAFSGVLITTSGSTTLATTGTTTISNSATFSGGLQNISDTYGARYASFIKQIHEDWVPIQGAYNLPATSYIGGYEFVKQGDDNHVYVDIVNDAKNATTSYDVKILYEYDTTTFKRKLIGFFVFDRTSGYYITKSGTNLFAGVTRTFVKDPLGESSIVPPTATTSSSSSGSGTSSTTNIPTLADIEQAYSNKRYLSVISLSDTYLKVNSATYDLLRLRYRTYFIIGKYNESLAEIAKIEALGKLADIACDAKVIATYSQNTALISKYTAACKE